MTHQQWEALQKANRVKQERAKLHWQVRELPLTEGRALLADVVLEPPDWMRTCPVVGALRWLPQCGPSRARQMARMAHVAPSQTVGSLTDEQRANLSLHLRGLLLVAERHAA